MIDLIRFTNDVFDNPSLSDPKLQAFANDHLIRLTQLDTDGTFAPLTAATSAAYSAYYGTRTAEATEEARGEGRTISTGQARTAVLNKLSLQRHLVAFTFGKQSDVYQTFFPQGMKAYRKAKADTLPALLKRYVAAAQTHLPPAEANGVEALATAYVTARNAQLTTASETDRQRTARRENRKAVTLQVTRNVLIIASHFLDNSDGFDDFFDLSLLPKKRKRKQATGS